MDQNPPQQLQTPLNTPRPPRKLTDFPIVPLLAVFSLLVVLIVITLSFLTVYTPLRIPLFESYNKELNLFFFKLPFFPKTSEQILINAVDKNSQIRSYNPDFSLTAQLASSTIEAASLDLAISGPVALNEDSVSFDISITAGASYQGQKYEASFRALQIEHDLYVKLDNVSETILGIIANFSGSRLDPQNSLSNKEISENVQKIFPNWISYATPGLDTEARKQLQKNNAQNSLAENAQENAQNFLLKSDILPSVKKMNDEDIEGTPTYHLVYKPTKEELKKAYEEYRSTVEDNPDSLNIFNEFVNGIETVEINIWIGKKDAILRKSSIVMSASLDFIQNMYGGSDMQTASPYLGYVSFLGLNPRLNVSSVLILKDVNKEFSFSPPTPTLSYQEYMTRLSDAFKTEEQKALDAQKKQADTDLNLISSALTKYYVAKSAYPKSLIELATTGYITDQDLTRRLNSYTYRVGVQNVAVFTLLSDGTSDALDQYYGFTSEFMYNRILTLSDLSKL